MRTDKLNEIIEVENIYNDRSEKAASKLHFLCSTVKGLGHEMNITLVEEL
jgi:hypothetical protein